MGDAYVDFILAHFVCETIYTVKDWGLSIDGQQLAEVFNQKALAKVSFYKPGKVIYNPFHKKYYAKDKERGDILDEIGMFLPPEG